MCGGAKRSPVPALAGQVRNPYAHRATTKPRISKESLML